MEQTFKQFTEEQNLIANMAAAGITGKTLNETETVEMTLEQLFAEHDKIRSRNAAKKL
jgi:hypothetical protein